VLSTAISDDESREEIALKLSRGAFADAEIEAMYTLQIGRKSEAISKAIQKSVLLGSTAVTTSSVTQVMWLRGLGTDITQLRRSFCERMVYSQSERSLR